MRTIVEWVKPIEKDYPQPLHIVKRLNYLVYEKPAPKSYDILHVLNTGIATCKRRIDDPLYGREINRTIIWIDENFSVMVEAILDSIDDKTNASYYVNSILNLSKYGFELSNASLRKLMRWKLIITT